MLIMATSNQQNLPPTSCLDWRCISMMGLTCAGAELIEQCIISYYKKVFGCANQRPEGPGLYGDCQVHGIRNERPATFCLAPLQPFIATVPDYLREMRNTFMIQCNALQLHTHGSVDIRTLFAMSTSETTTVTSNVFIDISDDVEIIRPLCKLKVNKLQVSRVIFLLIQVLYPCFKKCFCQMFLMKSFQGKILCFSTGFSRTCSPMDWEDTVLFI
jgi:hypothetical protein